MLRTIVRLIPALRLTRVTTTFAVVANIWFVILWTRATPEEPGRAQLHDGSVWLQVFGGFLLAAGLYSFAAASNDLLDIRQDRALKPDRPLASGALSPPSAMAVIVGSLVGAAFGASVMGLWSVRLTLILTLGILFYNFAGRHFPSVRFVTLGLIYAFHMFIPNPRLVFLWPIWAAMTHSLAVAAITHSLAGGRPALSRGAIAGATAGWFFWSAALLGLGWHRAGAIWPDWVHAQGAMYVGGLVLVFALLVWRIVRQGAGRQSADRVMRLGAFWLALYSAAWLLGQGYIHEGIGIASVAVVGFALAVGLHTLAARIDQPLDYRLS